MNAEQLEAWINDKACPLYFHDEENDDGYSGRAIMVSELEKLFAGKVLVPVEPTDAMVDALYPGTGAHTCRDLYQAMLAASQEQKQL